MLPVYAPRALSITHVPKRLRIPYMDDLSTPKANGCCRKLKLKRRANPKTRPGLNPDCCETRKRVLFLFRKLPLQYGTRADALYPSARMRATVGVRVGESAGPANMQSVCAQAEFPSCVGAPCSMRSAVVSIAFTPPKSRSSTLTLGKTVDDVRLNASCTAGAEKENTRRGGARAGSCKRARSLTA
eukprot:669799-Pleurochrysis_carterae.AAC.2